MKLIFVGAPRPIYLFFPGPFDWNPHPLLQRFICGSTDSLPEGCFHVSFIAASWKWMLSLHSNPDFLPSVQKPDKSLRSYKMIHTSLSAKTELKYLLVCANVQMVVCCCLNGHICFHWVQSVVALQKAWPAFHFGLQGSSVSARNRKSVPNIRPHLAMDIIQRDQLL